jgi:hypothetical protein
MSGRIKKDHQDRLISKSGRRLFSTEQSLTAVQAALAEALPRSRAVGE